MGFCGWGFPSQVADNFDEEIIFHPHKEALLFLFNVILSNLKK
jgi:hypothetical protein